MSKKNKKPYLYGTLLVLVLASLGFVFLLNGDGVKINRDSEAEEKDGLAEQKKAQASGAVSPFSGLPCENYEQRPFAVMLSGDAITRPLAGLNSADLVLNMPVITDSITRLMAVYVCGQPEEIGSIRSARDDFISFVQGWDVIYAHWGGSHFALDTLKETAVDNLDALPDYGNAFYRKSAIPMPHNGFTSASRVLRAAEKLKFNLKNSGAEIFPHLSFDEDKCQAGDCAREKTLSLGFPGQFGVEYKYKPEENAYFRYRGGTPEIDKNDGRQVKAKVVAVMKTTSKQIEGQYNDVTVIGSGEALVYQNGLENKGRWQKKSALAPLKFLTDDGQEIKFTPGQIWLEVAQTNQEIIWE